MKMRYIATLCVVALLLSAPFVGAQEDQSSAYEKILAAKADTVVNLKFVLKLTITMQGQSQDREQNMEVRGVLLGDTGLVVTSNMNFGGIPESVRRQYNLEVKATPVELKILFGNEIEEYEAQLVARDSNLNLAFVQILDLKGREVHGVDLRTGVDPKIGTEVIGVTRMGRGFDSAPQLGRLFVTAKVEKPRAMWAVNGSFSEVAHPLYNLAGELVGLLSIQEGSEGVSEGGGMGGGNDNIMPVILPLSDVVRSLKQAEERALEALAAWTEAKQGTEEAIDEATEGADEASEPKDAPKAEPKDAPKDEPGGDDEE